VVGGKKEKKRSGWTDLLWRKIRAVNKGRTPPKNKKKKWGGPKKRGGGCVTRGFVQESEPREERGSQNNGV